ncbi:hypothetical protein [Dasania marina]
MPRRTLSDNKEKAKRIRFMQRKGFSFDRFLITPGV